MTLVHPHIYLPRIACDVEGAIMVLWGIKQGGYRERTCRGEERGPVQRTDMTRRWETYSLAVTGFSFLALSTMNESRGFSIEAMQTIGLFVNKCVILRDELPADFRRINGIGCVRHYGKLMVLTLRGDVNTKRSNGKEHKEEIHSL